MLSRLHAEIGRVTDVSTSGVLLYDAQTDTTVYPIVYDQGQRLQIGPTPPLGPSGWVIRHRQPLLLSSHEEMEQKAVVSASDTAANNSAAESVQVG